jgi:16S rRNA (guanine1207-N2)-methyltransferase
MGHYFIEDTAVAPDERRFVYYCGGTPISFVSDAGLFSHGQVDGATDFLLRALTADRQLEHDSQFLDLGCGWGAVGVSLGKAYPNLFVTFADINPKALRFAEQNARNNGVRGRFVLSNAFADINGSFDCAALNPPIHAGREACRAMLLGCIEHLTANGALYVVMRKKHGAESFFCEATAKYCVDMIRKEKGVFVFRCVK